MDRADAPPHLQFGLTTKEAARLSGRSVESIKYLIGKKKLAAHKHGRDWVIDPQSLAELPPKQQNLGRPVGSRRPKGGRWKRKPKRGRKSLRGTAQAGSSQNNSSS